MLRPDIYLELVLFIQLESVNCGQEFFGIKRDMYVRLDRASFESPSTCREVRTYGERNAISARKFELITVQEPACGRLTYQDGQAILSDESCDNLTRAGSVAVDQ